MTKELVKSYLIYTYGYTSQMEIVRLYQPDGMVYYVVEVKSNGLYETPTRILYEWDVYAWKIKMRIEFINHVLK